MMSMPSPMLNVRRISCRLDAGARDQLEDRRDLPGRGARARRASASSAKIRGGFSTRPPPVMCAAALHGTPCPASRVNACGVDDGRPEQRVGDARAAELRRRRVERAAAARRARPCARASSRSSAARRRQADHDVAGDRIAAVEDLRRARRRRRRSRRGRSRRRGRCPGSSAVSPPTSAQPAWRQPSAMPPITLRRGLDVELAGREVVEEEERLGAGDEHVVDAHRDEVDADGVVAPAANAILSLVPTPSVPADQHRLGRSRPGSRAQRARSRRCRRAPRAASSAPRAA